MIDALYIPPKPAIIRPAEPALVKANFLPGWFPSVVMGAAAGFALVAQGVQTVNATSFALDPGALGASVGDFMIVGSLWEGDSAITSPSGWTNILDEEAPQTGHIARHNVDYRVFSGSVPGSQSWSYAGASGVAYAWAIFSGVSGVGTHSSPFDATGSTGLVSTSVTVGAGEKAAVIFSYADSATETGETAAFSGVEAEAHEDTSHVAGRYAMSGYLLTSGTVQFTTTQITRLSFQQFWVPLT